MLTYEFTRLLVSNFRACFVFYRDVLGLKPGFGDEHGSYADFVLGPVNISLFDKAEMAATLGMGALPARPASQDHVCLVFAVPNVDATWAQVSAHGATLVAPPTDHPDWGIRTAHFRDPDGNLIEVNQPLAQG